MEGTLGRSTAATMRKSKLEKFELFFEEQRRKIKLRDKWKLKNVTVRQINQHHKMLGSK